MSSSKQSSAPAGRFLGIPIPAVDGLKLHLGVHECVEVARVRAAGALVDKVLGAPEHHPDADPNCVG